jgi:5-hydroxyisourate hydrolase-like protein (transthyretin family)
VGKWIFSRAADSCELSGRVIDLITAEPVPGTEVRIPSLGVAALCDSLGYYCIKTSVPPACTLAVRTDRAEQEFEFRFPVDVGSIDVVLAAAGVKGALVGRILEGKTGSPASHVRVSAFRAGRRTEYSDSDGSGVFLFPGLTEGEWSLFARREGDSLSETANVTIAAGETTWVILSISQAKPTHGSISGVVLDEETGQPLPYVNVYISELRTGAVTDNDGYYRISKVLPGLQDVEVRFLGYERNTARAVRVISGECTLLDFTLRPGIVPFGPGVIPRIAP